MDNERSANRTVCHCAAWAALLLASAACASETLPEGVDVVSISVQPQSIELQHEFDYAQLLILGVTDSGEQVDLTRMVQLAKTSGIVSVEPAGLLRPLADGQDELEFTFGGHRVTARVRVSGVGSTYPVDFVRDIAPALSKMGCNGGTCHGSQEGKNGFKLSLRGYDYQFDHRALTDDLGSRRFNRAAPDQSLLLLKATGSIPHTGGLLTETDGPYYQMLRSWIAAGANLRLDTPRVVKIELQPENPRIPRAGMKQQMRVRATRADGTVRDVTREAFIESGNIEVIEADRQGLVTMLRRGEAPVLARYEGAYAATTLTILGDRRGFQWPPVLAHNAIDELVYEKLRQVKILPSDLCTDAEFVRRVYLDLTGLPPAAGGVRRFLADPRPTREKRDELIDRLIGSRAYVEHWTNKWADLLQVNRKFLGEEGAVAFRDWIKDAVTTNKPYDQFVLEILTASGSNLDTPAAAYWKILRDPAEAMENTTHLFLATRFNCNKCHDHPFERWTQDQYYQLAAYFAQVGRKEDQQYAGQTIGGTDVEGAKPLVEFIFDAPSGDVKHDRTGQVAPPAFPYQHGDGATLSEQTRRYELAQWITSPANPYFARSFVNRLWGYLLGVGIIEPIDDIRAGNPPTNPQLLDWLTEQFIESGFDVQAMLRTICQSRTYQHSIQTNQWNEDDNINYSHAIPRRLPAEVLYDAIHVAAGSTPRIAGVPVGLRAAELPDAGIPNPFLDDFGRPPRESACECDRTSGVALGPIMKLINGPTIAEALADTTSDLTKLVADQPDDQVVIEEVFLRFLARSPSQEEVALATETLTAAGADYVQAAEKLKQYGEKLAEKQAEWERGILPPPVWSVLDPTKLYSELGAQLTKQDDGSILAQGTSGKKDVYTIVAATQLDQITALRLEALPDPSLPNGGPGRAPNGNFVVSEITLSFASAPDGKDARTAAFDQAVADFSQDGWDVRGAIDGDDASGWAVMPEFGKPHTARFSLKEQFNTAGSVVLTVQIKQYFGDGQHTLGKFRLSVTNAPNPAEQRKLPENVARWMAIPAGERSAEQEAEIAAYYRSLDPTYQQLDDRARLMKQQADNRRLTGVQDLAWALINNPAFLFNR